MPAATAKRSKPITRISQLLPDEMNANRGTERGNAFIERSLREYGAGRSILIDKNGRIIAGNKTVENAGAMGLEEVQVVQTDGKRIIAVQRMDLDMAKDPKAREMALADNRSAELNLEWAGDILAEMGKEIDLQPFFSVSELAKVVGSGADSVQAPDPEIDRAWELREKWGTKTGQVWEIPSQDAPGRNHCLLIGDSTKKSDLSRLMATAPEQRANMLFTDPPYGVDYEGGRNPRSNRLREKLVGDSTPSLYSALAGSVQFCRDDAPWYVWFAGRLGAEVYKAIAASGYAVRALIIWNKLDAHYGNFMAQYMQKHEPCLYCVPSKPAPWYGPTNEVTVWDVKQPAINEHHPTQKPIELAVRAVANSSKKGDVIADWFLGSGTTACAAEGMGRLCYGMEIDPAFMAVTLERLSGMGLTPRLAA